MPGYPEKLSLADRMKKYESHTTEIYLLERTPIYARVDGRAFHTFCRSLNKPFDSEFTRIMEDTCKYLVNATGAFIGYVQSDEISLVWRDSNHTFFDGRLCKLESILASMTTAKFVVECMNSTHLNFVTKCKKTLPTFDARVLNLPNMDEVANMFLWRQNDAIKNSISSACQAIFSQSQLHNKQRTEQLAMLLDKGIDWNIAYPYSQRAGMFYIQTKTNIELPQETIDKIPEHARIYAADGKMYAMHNVVKAVYPTLNDNVVYLSDLTADERIKFISQKLLEDEDI